MPSCGWPRAGSPQGNRQQGVLRPLRVLLPVRQTGRAVAPRAHGGRPRAVGVVALHVPYDLGDDPWVREDAVVAEAGGGQQSRVRPGAAEVAAVWPAGLAVVAVVDYEQRRRGHLPGHRGQVEKRQRHAEAALDAPDHAGADALAEAEAVGERMRVRGDVDQWCDEHGAGGGEAVAQCDRRGRAAQRVGDHGMRRPVDAGDRAERLGELQDGAAAWPAWSGLGLAVAGAVEGDHPVAGADEWLDERAELSRGAAPPVDEVDGGSVSPGPARHRAALYRHVETVALQSPRGSPGVAGAGDREPQALSPAGAERRRCPLQQPEGPPDQDEARRRRWLETNDR